MKLSDVVESKWQKSKEKKQYLLLNKPKDYITTMDDPKDCKTVFRFGWQACMERVYPVED